jgi:hypothetical protein
MNADIATLITIVFLQAMGITLMNVILPYWLLLFFNWIVEQFS